jgi:hypothetical protein
MKSSKSITGQSTKNEVVSDSSPKLQARQDSSPHAVFGVKKNVRLRLCVAIALLSATGLVAQEMTAKSGTGILLNINESLRTDCGTNPMALMNRIYEVQVNDPAGKDGARVFAARCQDQAFHRCPTNFVLGDAIAFRIEKKDMVLTRADGKDLKTKVMSLRHIHQEDMPKR